MPNPDENALSSSNTPIQAGGAGSALDMRSERDRGLVRTAMKWWPKRWRGLTSEFKDELVDGLKTSRRECLGLVESDDAETKLKAIAAYGSIMRTAVMMEAQVQSDEHLEDHNARLDAGLATNRVDTAHTHELIAVDATARAAARALAGRLAPIETKAVYSKPVPNLNGHSNGTTNGTSNGHTNGTH